MRKIRLKLPRCRQLPTHFVVVLIIVIFLRSADADTPQYPELGVLRGTTAGGYLYMNGGVSHDEQRAMEQAGKIYNLKLVFTRSVGTPVAPDFVIIGANSNGRIDKVSPRGPWFYIQLPPGGYTILARFAQQVVLVRDVKLTEGGRATVRLRGD